MTSNTTSGGNWVGAAGRPAEPYRSRRTIAASGQSHSPEAIANTTSAPKHTHSAARVSHHASFSLILWITHPCLMPVGDMNTTFLSIYSQRWSGLPAARNSSQLNLGPSSCSWRFLPATVVFTTNYAILRCIGVPSNLTFDQPNPSFGVCPMARSYSTGEVLLDVSAGRERSRQRPEPETPF